MADYSKEYWEIKTNREPKSVKNTTLLDSSFLQGESTIKGDFSFYDEFRKLQEGETTPLICEGFGTKGIGIFDGQYIVLMIDGSEKTLDKLLIG